MTEDQITRFWAKVDRSGGDNACWTWKGTIDRGGYGKYGVSGRSKMAHRIAYELLVGPIPEGLQLDHQCRHRNCCNPAHLEPVSVTENQRRRRGYPSAGDFDRFRGIPFSEKYLLIHEKARAKRLQLYREMDQTQAEQAA